MNITPINKINFGYYPARKLSSTPRTGDEANEYFLAIDEQTRKIPTDSWDKLYAMDEEDKLKAVDFMKATYLSVPRYFEHELLNPQELTPTINRLLKKGNILEEDEIETLKAKLEGTFSPDKLSKYVRFKRDEEDTHQGNLWFLKDLIVEEPEIFETMAPKTVNKILLNHLLTYDDFSSALEEIKDGELLTPPKDLIYQRRADKKEFQRMVLHECLLGESYYKDKATFGYY